MTITLPNKNPVLSTEWTQALDTLHASSCGDNPGFEPWAAVTLPETISVFSSKWV